MLNMRLCTWFKSSRLRVGGADVRNAWGADAKDIVELPREAMVL